MLKNKWGFDKFSLEVVPQWANVTKIWESW